MLAINFSFIPLVSIQCAKYFDCLSRSLNFSLGIGYLTGNFGWDSVMLSFIIITSFATATCYIGYKANIFTPLKQTETKKLSLKLFSR